MAAAASVIVRTFRFTRALRFRIAVSYVLFFTVLLAVLLVVFRKSLENTFDQQTRALLEDDWDAVKGYLRLGTANGNEWFFDAYDPDEAFIVNRLRRIYMLADSEGHALQWSPIYSNIGFDEPDYIKSVLKSGKKAARIRYDRQHVPYMILSGPAIDERHHVYYIAIGRPIDNNQKALAAFTRKYFTILPLAIAVSALFGWFLAGRALSPVNHVAQTAERITHSNLNLRLQTRGAFDELDRLIESFNRMMERLNLSFEQMRQFSTDVSHELRTPLTVIRGQLEVALFTANTVEQYREAMLNALEDVERLSNIVRALLMLSQAESGQLALNKTRMDLCALLGELTEQYQIVAEAAGVELSHNLPQRHCYIYADKVQMERLITNLLSNGIKYTRAAGHVRVRVETRGDTVSFIVEDDGVGIAADHLPHIFDRFYRVPSADPEKGLGLGLSFVAWIVKAHGGTIDVQSELEKGTRFTVTLPASAAADGHERAPFAEAQLGDVVEHPGQPNPVN
jgi:heavy metal sensor kinase